MITNITILALNNNLKKIISKSLAKKLDMFYLDIPDIIKFDLETYSKIMNVNGVDFYNKLENDAFKRACAFENTVITTELDLINKDNNFALLKASSLIIYLKLDYEFYKEKLIEERPRSNIYEENLKLIVFNERNKIMSDYSDIVINVTHRNEKRIVNLIIKEIQKYYNKLYKKN